jgi:hypothetical protein
MDFQREMYYGWLIVVTLENSKWAFECHKPEGEEYLDTELYPLPEDAIYAAKELIQRETARSALAQGLSNYAS